MSPYLDTDPYVGLSPTTPQKLAGCLTEPPVSVPRANSASEAAAAQADPPDEPPGTFSKLYGFRVNPKADVSVDTPIANSSKFVLPKKTGPACFNFLITVAS